MAELRQDFSKARMNKDMDERLVPNGEYRDANNIQIATSDSSEIGTVQSLLRNISRSRIEINSTTGKPLKQTIGREEAIEIFSKSNPNFVNLDPETQNQQIQAVINLYNNTEALINKDLKVDEGGGFDLGGFLLDSLGIIFN